MVVTPEEAKEKWCPFIRHYGTAGIGVNRYYSENRPELCCIGPQCMAWRWVPPVNSKNTHGICGLAGAPMVYREAEEIA